MKKYIVFLVPALFLIICTGLNAQSFSQSERAIIHKLHYEKKPIILSLDKQLDIQPWMGNQIKFIVEIQLENEKPDIIRSLAQMGRYELKIDRLEHLMFVSTPNLRKMVEVNGIPLQEDVRIKVLLPEWMKTVDTDFGTVELTVKDDVTNEILAGIMK